MNIYLIRHGNKELGLFNENVNLSELGFKQADITGKRLKEYDIDIIYSSPLKRSVQTAEKINEYLKVDIEIREELKEIYFGDMELKDRNFIDENYSEFYKQLNRLEKDLPYPNGECGQDVYTRAIKIVDETKEKNYKNVVFVAHGGTLRALISGILGLKQENRLLIGAPYENCSISIIKYDEENKRYCIHVVNDYSHLTK